MMPREPYYSDLGRRIQQARNARGFTQVEVAERVGVTRGTLENMEHGRIRVLVHRLVDIARVLGVPAHELLRGGDGATCRR